MRAGLVQEDVEPGLPGQPCGTPTTGREGEMLFLGFGIFRKMTRDLGIFMYVGIRVV